MISNFVTENGIVVPAVTTEQMREIDRIAVEETGPSLLQMMENAGRNLAELSLNLLDHNPSKLKILILGGSGGNGGGGLCTARHLANRGVQVEYLLVDPYKLSTASLIQFKILRSTNAVERTTLPAVTDRYNLIIDCLIGYGLQSIPRGKTLDYIQYTNESKIQILSLDVPSGVDATTGNAPSDCIQPHWTMTLALPKTGLLPEKTGQLFLADIGIPTSVYARIGINYLPPFEKHFWTQINIL